VNKQLAVYSATDANRHFSKLLKRVEKGETILITSRNRVVAEMRPGEDGHKDAEMRARREAAMRDLLARARKQPYLHLGKFNRDELYD
jgi:antitoxin (DNA-binding transcriptional repressor) of toxin-antitoxin stability system